MLSTTPLGNPGVRNHQGITTALSFLIRDLPATSCAKLITGIHFSLFHEPDLAPLTEGLGEGDSFQKVVGKEWEVWFFLPFVPEEQLAAAVCATHRRAHSSKQTGIQLNHNPAQRISLIDLISLKGGFDRKFVFWWKQIPCQGSGILWNIVFIHEKYCCFGCWKWNLKWNYSFKLFPAWKKFPEG